MSKRRKTGIIVLSLLVMVLFVRLDHGPVRFNRQRQPKSRQQAEARDCEKYHARTFSILNVIDGDTIDIDAPDGRNNYTRIRLLGIDAPETHSEQASAMYFGPQAAEFTRKLTLGKSVTVYLDMPNPTRCRYGRLLAYLQLPDGRFLNEVLLAEGCAYADVRFQHSFLNKYRQLEASARSRKKGLWQNVTADQLPQWRRENPPNPQAEQ
jgi:endonuclease YncB( thermonuclease family)